MRLILLTSLAFLLIPSLLPGQKEPMKFGKVPPEDLAMTVYDADTSAASVVLGEYGHLKFLFKENDVQYAFRRHKRIKVLKRAGFDQGDIDILFYSKNNMEEVRNIKALVITPDGKVTDVSKREIFEERVNEHFSRKRFTIPNLTEGCIIEYQYDTNCKSIFQLPEWYFQYDIPVRWSELRLGIPQWYDYIYITQGRKPDITDNYLSAESFYVPGGTGSSGSMSVNVSHIRFVMKDVPSLKEEPYITTMDDYYARMRFQLSSVAYPNSPVKNVMNSWEEAAKDLMESDKFGGQLKRKRNYEAVWREVAPYIQPAATPQEKCQAIYDFVSSNINLEPGRGVFVRKDFNDCFAKKKAKSHELNLLLVALLREAGLEAYPVLVSNRDHGKAMPMYPLMDQFDNVLALATIGEGRLLLDVTDPHRPMGYPSVNALNSTGWAVIEGAPQWIDIVPPSSSDTYLLNLSLTGEGTLDGSITLSTAGYSAIKSRELIRESPTGQHFKKKITDRCPDARVDSMSFDGHDISSKSFKAVAVCQLPAMAQVSGDFIYLAPALMSNFTKNPFKSVERTYPVEMPYPIQERIVLNLALPDGYGVDDLPEPVNMVLPDEAGKFNFQISESPRGLQLVSTLQINRTRYQPDDYPALHNFFSIVEQKMGEFVVLKRG